MKLVVAAAAIYPPAAALVEQHHAHCTGLDGTAQCCATDVLGLANRLRAPQVKMEVPGPG
jgi:hypothetical protein